MGQHRALMAARREAGAELRPQPQHSAAASRGAQPAVCVLRPQPPTHQPWPLPCTSPWITAWRVHACTARTGVGVERRGVVVVGPFGGSNKERATQPHLLCACHVTPLPQVSAHRVHSRCSSIPEDFVRCIVVALDGVSGGARPLSSERGGRPHFIPSSKLALQPPPLANGRARQVPHNIFVLY